MKPQDAFRALTFGCIPPSVGLDVNGHWYVSPSAEIAGDGLLRGVCGRSSESIEGALLDAWAQITHLPADRHLLVTGPRGVKRRVRWTGFMFEEVES